MMFNDSTTLTVTSNNNAHTGWIQQLDSSNCVDYGYPYTTGVYQWPYTVRVEAPRECAGDIHVFPCPHCDKCKCGGAEKRDSKKKRPKC